MRVSNTKKVPKSIQSSNKKSTKKALSRIISNTFSEKTFGAVSLTDIVRQEVMRQEVMRAENKNLMVRSSENNINRTITFAEQESEKIQRAQKACQNILKLCSPCGLQEDELYKIALFIETKLQGCIANQKYYLSKDTTKLARTIEYDPHTNRVFIHLKNHGVSPIGRGCHKKVTRSILYDVDSPEAVANSTMQDVSKKEIWYLKKFIGAKGLAETYAITEHKKKHSNTTVINIIQKLYTSGTLYHYQHNPQELTQKEKLYIARDLIQGLESLHSKDIAHRDLHGNNFLLHRQEDLQTGKTIISAVLIDLGQALKTEKAKEKTPLIEIPKRFNPAESFWRKSKSIDAKAIDIYALGMNLYHLYFGVAPEWAPEEKFKKITHMSGDEKVIFRKKLINRTQEVLDKRRREVENCKSDYALLEKTILQMCNPYHKHRGSASQHRQALDSLITTLS